MDDDDDRRLLDFLGDVDALNDYLHGSNSKSIEEDDVTNAAYGSDGSFFASNTTSSNTCLKDGSSSMGDFGEDSAGAGLQLSSSLSFIEDDLGAGSSPEEVDLGGEDQPFDILQKSLLEADITEQTLAQEALLDSQPAPTLVQAPVPFSSQLVSGGYGGGVGVVTTATPAFPAGQLLQGMSPVPNGSTQHIQVLGSFGAGGGVMTLSSLERTPQIVLRPGVPVATAGAAAGGQVFTPNQGQVGQVGLPFKNIPLQNIIIQRGPGGTQAIVRPIQPKPPQTGSQSVYSLGLQPTPTTVANTAAGGQYTANGTIVVQPPPEQQQAQAQTNVPPGQFLIPNSLTLTPSSAIHNGATNSCSSALISSQNAVQIAAGQNFAASPGGQLILNQGVVSGSQVVGAVTQTWAGVSCAGSTPTQTSCAPGRLTLVGPATAGIGGPAQASACPVQRLLVTQTQNCASLSPLPGSVTQEQKDFRQNSSLPAFKQAQLGSIHVMKTIMQNSTPNSEVSLQKRPISSSLTRGELILEHLRRDHAGVQTPDRRKFASVDDALQRLLPYHAFQGAPPSQDEFSQVDEEFEVVAAQVLMRTEAMVNKYRRLLMVEAERSSPSSEMVMIDRTFNQEERSNLTQDKRTVLVDPDNFLEDFCCGIKSKLFQDPVPSQSADGHVWAESEAGSVEPVYRTDSQPGFGDPGGGGAAGLGPTERLHSSRFENNKVLEMKRPPPCFGPSGVAAKSYSQGKPAHFAATSGGQTHFSQPQYSPQIASPSHPDTDSALEAAVNSILEC
ncbi:BRD4-interacting chromatin-remodeling complex-associated protein-like [Kryptolebias marmoratus]|uniref:BICRA like chromatin remodeling complex associated protein n=1 Tax=Kryptolebias marmoratus TaxID=37003 RepID=A0A3Q3FF56_KRYMA|nr:BRD4-interacting chromatin-remodeling complex-associated protein-like [Kryptolebias marmoratus]XP_017292961.1 BRD4-interacting chromatin-remodeling complex-associated protein-like [Kryptolebias marmoratus]